MSYLVKAILRKRNVIEQTAQFVIQFNLALYQPLFENFAQSAFYEILNLNSFKETSMYKTYLTLFTLFAAHEIEYIALLQ